MRITLIVATLAIASVPLRAEETPEKAVAAYFAGMSGTNFESAVKQVHPSELAKLKEMVLPVLLKAAQTNGFPPSLRPLTHDESPADLVKIPTEQVFIRLMTWATASQPMMAQLMKATSTTPLGSVKEGEVVHVVCRQTATQAETNVTRSMVVAVSTMKDNDSWKLALQQDVQWMVQRLSMSTMPRPSFRPPGTPAKTPSSPSFGPIAPKERPTTHVHPAPASGAATTPPAVAPAVTPAPVAPAASATPAPASK